MEKQEQKNKQDDKTCLIMPIWRTWFAMNKIHFFHVYKDIFEPALMRLILRQREQTVTREQVWYN